MHECEVTCFYLKLYLCRFELFNSKVRAYNVFSNRLSSSRDNAQHFAAIQHLRYVCQAHSFSDNERYKFINV